MLEGFGEKVKGLRAENNITREELCGNEAELSIRQLARIESGKSIPNLSSVNYIAKQLGVSIGSLTDGQNIELPKRYKELKYQLLRNPTYLDKKRIEQRELQLDEVFIDFYENLPEVEKLIMDCLQASLDVALSHKIEYGTDILNEYIEQLTLKDRFNYNELILIDLYLICYRSSGFCEDLFDINVYKLLFKKAIKQINLLEIEELCVLNQLMVTFFSIAYKLNHFEIVESIIETTQLITRKVNDFHRIPILYLMEWKYYLKYKNNKLEAKRCYHKAIHFTEMTGDDYLKVRIYEEWKKDKGM